MQQVVNSIIDKLQSAPNNIDFDSSFKRWGDDLSNWFVGHEYHKEGKTYYFASFGNWRTGEYYKYPSDNDIPVKVKEEFKEVIKQQEEDHISFQKEKAAKQKEIFYNLNEKNEVHQYLKNKNINSNYKARVDKNNNLVIPVYDFQDFWGVQRINTEGQKFFSTGVKLKSSFCVLKSGTLTPSFNGKIYFCEGYATACTIFEATGKPTVVCFNAGNLDKVVKRFANHYGDAEFIICADNDAFTEIKGKPFNTGIVKAQEACKNVDNITMVYPKFKNLETKPTDFNDLHCLESLEEVKKQIININPFEKDIKEGFTTFIHHKNGKTQMVREYIRLKEYFEYLHPYKFYKNTKSTFTYSNGYYNEMDKIFIDEFAQKHFKPAPQQKKTIDEFYNLVTRYNCVDKEFFEIEQGYVNLKNGVFDFNTKKLLDHGPRFGFTSVNDYDYDKDAKDCPVWDKWLNIVTSHNQESKNAIEEYIAYAMAKIRYDLISNVMIFSGTGKNGKSVTISLIKTLIGDNNCNSASIEDMEKNIFTSATLHGKLLNIAEEENPKCFTKTDKFKRLTSGNEVQGQFKNKPIFNFVNYAKFIMTYNTIPDLKDDSYGLKRRLVIIPFKHRFTHDDYIPDVEGEVKKERSAIFNRLVVAYERLMARGSVLIPESSNTEYDEMLVSSDAFYIWFDENVEITKDQNIKCSIKELYKNYHAEVEYPLNKYKFGRKLKNFMVERNIEQSVFKKNNSTYKGYSFLKIQENSYQEGDEF